jgi:CRISPR-associated protein Cmr3
MNTLLLQPTDVLFFRDGRPMGGSLSGHAAAWPLPTVTNAALHAALHRADLESALGGKLHGHDHHRRDGSVAKDVRKFGSLLTAGPFPVLKHKDEKDTWLFPRPLDVGLDANENDDTAHTLHPLATDFTATHSSLPKPLRYAVANQNGPTKKTPSTWWNAAAWECYLGTGKGGAKPCFHKNEDFADTEFSYGIGMDAESGTQDGERFYSAHYLRLKPDARLGLLATAKDKNFRDSKNNDDLVISLFPNSGSQTPVIVGGQQRLCTVEAHHKAVVPLPKGKTTGFESTDAENKPTWLVKWVLLTPAIFPEISAGTSKRGTERKAHPGGWLPTWICPESGNVLLQTITAEERQRRRKLNYAGQGYESQPDIPARLFAALTGKPIPVTGYALPHEAAGRDHGTAKPTYLAVPAGSVYYFQADSEEAAEKLAVALNWHSAGDFTSIRNRRSTLFGEKGFGLGVCSTWHFHNGELPT